MPLSHYSAFVPLSLSKERGILMQARGDAEARGAGLLERFCVSFSG